MYFLIGAFNIIAVMLIIRYWYKRHCESSIKAFFFPALVIKISAGLLMGVIYKFYYEGGDTFIYFKDAIVLADAAYNAPLEYWKIIFGTSVGNLAYTDQPRALFFVKILSLPAIITFKNYWISGLYLSLFSFFGTWKLASLLSRLLPNTKIPAVIAFLFYPSFVFWSSGVLKEPVTVGCLSLCLVIYLPYLLNNKKISLTDFFSSILLLTVVLQLKFYYAVVFIPLLFVGIVISYLKARIEFIKSSVYLQCILSILLLIMLYFPISYLHPLLNIQNILFSIVRNHDWFLMNGAIPIQDYIHFVELKPELFSFIRNFPLALFSGLFRPTIFDAHNPFQYLVAVENLFLIILFVASFFNSKAFWKSKNLYLIFILSFYIFTLACVLAFAAPNFGTLMRYKVAFLPFLVYLILAKNPIISYCQNIGK